MKKTLAVAAALLLLFCGCSNSKRMLSSEEAAEYICTAAEVGFTYSEYGGYVVIDKCDALFGEVVIPARLKGKTVTAIGDGAFADCRDVTSVVIPEGVVTVGRRAFAGCTALLSVTLPATLENVGLAAFVFCSSLESVTLPAGVKQVGDHAFRECGSLTSVVVEAADVSFGEAVFTFCSSKLTVFAPSGSTAETYAEDSDIRFKVL